MCSKLNKMAFNTFMSAFIDFVLGTFLLSPHHLLQVIFFGETNVESPYNTRMK